MQNVFDQSQYPSREPRTAAVRDRLVWRRDDLAAVYLPTLYSLAYSFVNQANPAPRTAAVRDRLVWRRDDLAAVYSPTLYSLAYSFVNQANPADILEFNATESDGAYIIEITSDDSAAFAAGDWTWEAIITRTSDGESAIVDRGYIELTDSEAPGHILRVLNAIRATIEGTATEDQSRIEIGGRVLERRSIKELTDLEIHYSRRWSRAKASIDRKAGRPVSRVLVKMGA